MGVNLAYPFGDLLLLVFVAVGFALSGWRPGRSGCCSAGDHVTAVADMVYVYQVAEGTYVEGNVLDTYVARLDGVVCASRPGSRRRRRTAAA